MYHPSSPRADEFIDHQEILDTLAYAEAHKTDVAAIDGILRKARECKGLDHREASVLLACALPDKAAEIETLARQMKQDFYGNRIVMFAPLYLSNYCVNGCVYCPYHLQNKHMPRRKLSQEEIAREVTALQDMGHKRLALETGEHPLHNPIEYVLESIQTIYGIKHRNGAIRRVNVNIAATTAENYRRLRDAGIGTYILFQETYHRESYELLHPTGPKHNYAWHTEAMDRAMAGGIDDVGLGVLFGLERYRYEFAALLMHAEHLEAAFGVGPHTVSVPRIKPADGVDPDAFANGIDDDTFARIVACIRVSVPYTGMIISTRESQAVRARTLALGISQISGASRTSVGGYADGEESETLSPADHTEQFEVSDNRTLDEVVRWLMKLGYIPSFCTACYREGRTGDRFMQLCKSGQILNCCHPNALMTLEEYLLDYASPATRALGENLIAQEIEKIPSEKMRALTLRHLGSIRGGERDFRV
ncbi:MAG: [FeFe] hydrogenase H-cluster radical SAM maturase HydG [Oscillospiraceae bacterium]|jgi:2-iminoacetate synthase|nr:[FeFe] hydrogenase H-cluster radical SAM maturase HydG [Oscillospiraceae bacterium]